ncbi:MAG: hypothetical protein GY862_01145, partial [Gammaproteobacteria bacterium]|nr:hypothetical protein [Gammaproteobacteria bacterium]
MSGLWTLPNSLVLGEEEQRQVQVIRSHLLNYQVHLMNEATVWSRAIYPLLLLAERKSVQAWAEVSLCACYKNFIIEGIADGVLGRSVAGRLE